MRSFRTAAVAAFASLLPLVQPTPALANDKTTAEALYEQGKTLLAAGKYDEACPKFAASNEADPSVGALLHLADCQEKLGKIATAWATFREASGMATRQKQDPRAKIADERAAALLPKLPKVVLVIAGATPAGLTLKRDGAALSTATLGTAVPVDPGKHVIDATAPGKKPLTFDFIATEGQALQVSIPPFVDEPGAPPPVLSASAAPPAAASSAPPAPSADPPPPPPPSDKKTLGLALGAAGIVGVGVGTFFGLRTMSKWSASKDKCQDTQCSHEGAQLASDAKTAGNISTIGFVLGAAALGAGGYFYFSAGKQTELSAAATPSGGFVSVGGTY